MGAIWHIAFAVPSLEQGMEEFGTALGLDWRPVHEANAILVDEDSREHEVVCKFTFSVGAPFAIEMWEAVPGSPLAPPGDTVLHHVGYWVDDLVAEATRLEDLGWPCFMRAHSIAVHRGPGGIMLEPCDVGRDRPFLRDLFPPGSQHHGAPDNNDAKTYSIATS